MEPLHTKIRVLICDDHRIIREGLKQIIADSSDIVVQAEAENGEQAITQALALLAQQRVDVVLLDIAMPSRDGLDVLVALKRAAPNLPILMLSTYPEHLYAVRSMKLGASAYLNKSTDPDELLTAIRRLAAGGEYSPSQSSTLRAALNEGIDKLSDREHQVYRLLISGMSVTQIGAELHIATNTVSTYRARILEKTGTKNDVELAQYAASLAR
jgi:two-component system, NarL family, invasion response regulator UvrY